LKDQIDRDRKLNLEFGMNPSEDTLPRRFIRQSLEQGPTRGSVIHIDKLVKEYYRIKGWSKKLDLRHKKNKKKIMKKNGVFTRILRETSRQGDRFIQ
jgi:aldehyde:ferredoxin oxidoreductase